MRSEWRVSSNLFGDRKMYIVYRLRDASAVDHSGNREYYGGYTDIRQDALDLAAALNRGEVPDGL